MTKVKFLIGDIKDLHKLDDLKSDISDEEKGKLIKHNKIDTSNLKEVTKKLIDLK